MSAPRPIKLVIAALGGQGGGVLADWLIEVARHEKHLVQSTSVPGVAQRTGATIYYLEFFPRSLLPQDGSKPVMALMPHPGDVDLVIASEIMEAGRALQRGIVTPDRTTLIASSNRVYAIGEKSHMADGRADEARITALARESSKQFISFDMQEIAVAHGSVISAAMLGALAGSGALPFSRESYRTAIREGGIAVDRSLAAFDAAAQAAHGAASSAASTAPLDTKATVSQPDSLAWRSGSLPSRLLEALKEVPSPLLPVVTEGVHRLVDYQDVSYAQSYLTRLQPIFALEPDGTRPRLSEAVARGLALWMSFEDAIRVADLKIRSSRARRVLGEVAAGASQLVSVTEFMKPRVEEICGTLPAGLGRRMQASPSMRGFLKRFTAGRQVRTSRVGGFTLLYGLAGLRRFRRGTLRFLEEDTRIQAWLGLIQRIAPVNYDLALEVAECQRLVKGYGSTHERGVRNFELIIERAAASSGEAGAAALVRNLRTAAFADEEGMALRAALAG